MQPNLGNKIDASDVRLAFLLLLGRAPESEAIVDYFIREVTSVAQLGRRIMSSNEFMTRAASHGSVFPAYKPLNWPPCDVQTNATSFEFQKLLSHVEATWSRLGETKPFWSVLTSEKYAGEVSKDALDSFYESGADVVALFKAAVERSRGDVSKIRTCFELGCGVGRVTMWLSRNFASVTAGDISLSHLKIAENQLRYRGVSNTEFMHIEAIESFRKLKNFDCVFSVITLQHSPPPISLLMLEKMLSIVKPQGFAYFQVLTYQLGYQFSTEKFLRNSILNREMEMHVIPQSVLFDLIYKAGFRLMEVREDGYSGDPSAISNSILCQRR